MSKNNNIRKKDLNPLDYNHKHASLRRFAEHASLRDVRLRTLQSYYRQIRLLSEWLGGDGEFVSVTFAFRYDDSVSPVGATTGFAPSFGLFDTNGTSGDTGVARRQAVAAMRMYYCGMLGKGWKLWDVVKVRDTRRLPMVLDIGQVASVLNQVALLRHRVPLHLIYCCGLRLQECVLLTVDDIEPGAVIVRDGKGGKERRVPLSEPVYRELQRYWLQHRNPKWLFPTPGRGRPENARERMGRSAEPMGKGALQKAFHDAVVASRIRKKATIHTLRHSYATHLLAMGVNIRQLQLYLGHEDIETTTIYLHLIPFGEERSMEHIDAIARMTR